jgi:alkaline phosphatase D
VFGLLVLVGGGLGCQHFDAGAGRATASPDELLLWAGAITSTSARVHARVPSATEQVRLRVHPVGDAALARTTTGVRSALFPDVHHFRLSGLTPATAYRYVVLGGDTTALGQSGRFRTFADGPQSFRVALGACAETGSRHPVFDAIRNAAPDLMLHMGDLHYEDIEEADPQAFRSAYHRVHASPEQAALFRSVPIAYMWDDHDYGPNNSSARAPGQGTAQTVYRAYVPHYNLPAGPGRAPVYQAFTVGRVRFLLTDLRSARTPNDAVDAPNRTMMGAAQKRWFKAELAAARDRYPLIAWVSSVPWIANDPDALDRWSGFPDERRELATYIDSIGVADQLVVLSGDAHMVALDDGSNNQYGAPNGGGFPVVHAAALDRRGSVKGGPYSHGSFPNRVTLLGANDGQFVLMDVTDTGGDTVCARWTGKRYRYDTHEVVDLLQWETCFDVPGEPSAKP